MRACVCEWVSVPCGLRAFVALPDCGCPKCKCYVTLAYFCQRAKRKNVPTEGGRDGWTERKRGNLLLLTLFNMRLISSGELTTHEILQQTFLVAISLARFFFVLSLICGLLAAYFTVNLFCDLIKILAQLRLIRFRFHFRSPFSVRRSRSACISRLHVASGSISLIRSVAWTSEHPKRNKKSYHRHAHVFKYTTQSRPNLVVRERTAS